MVLLSLTMELTVIKASVLFDKNKYLLLLVIIFFLVLIWSAINPKEYFTWFLEAIPGIVGFMILLITYKRFKFTNFAYSLILIHCCILFIGGHYTYAENPLFEYFKKVFNWERNNYDKLGHFAQGFIPSIVARELLIRMKIMNNRKWLVFFIVCIALSISAVYEFIEWWTALLIGESADAFLGTQGYIWDTQSDMLYAFIGSVTALIFLSRYHDKTIRKEFNE